MKKRLNSFYGLLAFFALIGILTSGCQEENTKSIIPEPFEELLFHGDREKNFGVLQYNELSQKEAEELLQEKFSLPFPPLVAPYEELLTKNLIDQESENPTTDSNYSIMSNQDLLQVKGEYTFTDAQSELLATAIIEAEYVYMPATKQSILAEQAVTIIKADQQEAFPNDSAEAIIEQLGQLLKVQDLAAVMTNFRQAYPEATNPELLITDNAQAAHEAKGVRSAMFANVLNGSVEAIYGRLVDYTYIQ